jgi:hypothetical protein
MSNSVCQQGVYRFRPSSHPAGESLANTLAIYLAQRYSASPPTLERYRGDTEDTSEEERNGSRKGERASAGRVCSEHGTLKADRRAIQSSAWKDDHAAVGGVSDGDHRTSYATRQIAQLMLRPLYISCITGLATKKPSAVNYLKVQSLSSSDNVPV